MNTGPIIDAARQAADWLDMVGEAKRAEDVRRLCRSNVSLRRTLSQLHADDAALRAPAS